MAAIGFVGVWLVTRIPVSGNVVRIWRMSPAPASSVATLPLLNPDRLNGWKAWSAAIFVLAMLVRCAAILVASSSLGHPGGEPLAIARTLAADGRYADAFGPGVGPTAHTAPLHPLLLSLVVRTFRGSGFEDRAYELWTALAAALGFALLPWVAVAGGLGRSAGIVGGLAGALLPINFWSQAGGVFEAPFVALALLALLALFSPRFERGHFDVPSALKIGFAAGIALLVSPTLLPVLVAWILICLLRYPLHRRAVLRQSAVAAGCALLLLTPWAVRNHRVFGQWIWTRSNLGLELQVSNNDLATADLEYNVRQSWMAQLHPYQGSVEREKVRLMGEPAYNRAKMDQALAWIVTHRQRFAALTLQRVWLFWVPQMRRHWQSALEVLLSVCGLAGLVVAFRQRLAFATVAISILIVFPAIYYVIQVSARYRYPIEPLLFLLSGYLAAHLWRWMVSQRPVRQ